MTRLQRAACLLLLAAAIGPAMAADLAVTNVTVYPAPDAVPLRNATVIIRAGRITEVGRGLDPGELPVLDGGGRVATAGLWNCHVHFTDPALAAEPGPILEAMLLRYGFTSVLDTGSLLVLTRRLAAEIDAGRLAGPRIFTANGSLVFTDGTPSYLPDVQLPEVATVAEAEGAVAEFLDAGADGIKIFSGSFQGDAEPILLPPPLIRAIADAAHARGAFVVAHPTNREGLVNAVANGVDVLAHTAPDAGPLRVELLAAMRERRIGLIPTLKLWSWELERAGRSEQQIAAFQGVGIAQLRDYFAAGGEVLFGTDVGYMRDYDPAEEFVAMAQAGMDFRAILAALTTNPARRFAGESGRLEPGGLGDLVIFARDPATDPAAFAEVAVTVTAGRVAYAARP